MTELTRKINPELSRRPLFRAETAAGQFTAA